MIVKKYCLGFGYPEVVCKRKCMQIYKTIDVVVEITDWHKITKLLWYAAIVCTKVVAKLTDTDLQFGIMYTNYSLTSSDAMPRTYLVGTASPEMSKKKRQSANCDKPTRRVIHIIDTNEHSEVDLKMNCQ